MKKATEKLLKSLGVPEDYFPDLDKDDFDPTPVIEKVNELNKEQFYKVFENDSEYQQIIKDKAVGQVKSTYDNHLKKFGFVDEKNLPIHEKLQLFADFFKEKVKKELNIPDVAKEVEELQKKNLDLQNEFTEKEKSYQEQIEQAKKENVKVNQKLSDIELNKMFLGVDAKTILGGKHSDGLFKAVRSSMAEKYDFHYDDGLSFTLKGKESKPTAKIDGKEVILENNQVLLNEMKELGFINESNGSGGSGGGAQEQGGTPGEVKRSPEYLKMKEQIEQAQRQNA